MLKDFGAAGKTLEHGKVNAIQNRHFQHNVVF
jgi:hypothetical protein